MFIKEIAFHSLLQISEATGGGQQKKLGKEFPQQELNSLKICEMERLLPAPYVDMTAGDYFLTYIVLRRYF